MEKLGVLDPKVQTMGRLAQEADCLHFYWPGSSITVRFTGKTLKLCGSFNCIWGTNSLGIVVDGRLSKIPLRTENNGKQMELLIADNMEEAAEHTCIIFKQLDDSYDYRLYSVETDGQFLMPEPLPELKLEFYGDSVTSGAAIECVDYVAHTDPCSNDACYDNSWFSYAWQTARRLHAQVHLTSQGGIAVFDHTGYFHYPDTIGMENTWNKLCYFSEAGELTDWDFSKYTPDAVMFAIGQNDQHDAVNDNNLLTVSDPAYRVKWKEGYSRIIRNVASQYPASTRFVCMTTVLMHDRCWDEAIDEVVNELRAEGLQISHFYFSRNGAATPGHPRIPEHNEMAEELTAYLTDLLK